MNNVDKLLSSALVRGYGNHPKTRERAIDTLERMHSDGTLKPIPGWPGDVVDGYMDILGLNDRPIRGN